MARQLKIAGHLPVEDLERRYREARDPVARSQWQIVWQLALGRRIAEVEEHTGYSDRWIREIASRYNQLGPDGIADRRHANRGRPQLLTTEQEQELARRLEGPAPDGGLWSGPKVAAWMSGQLGRPVDPTRGWEVLRRLDYRLGRPRPRHTAASPEAQAAFKGGAHRAGKRGGPGPTGCPDRRLDDGRASGGPQAGPAAGLAPARPAAHCGLPSPLPVAL